jgi:hypothetical protein
VDSVGTYKINGGTLTVDGNIGVGTAGTGNNVFWTASIRMAGALTHQICYPC